jgi:hypothetical protein
VEVDSTLEKDIRNVQLEDARFKKSKSKLRILKLQDSVLMIKERCGTRSVSIPEVKGIRELILREAHDSTYSIHPGSTKMYHDLKSRYWWYEMKRVVAQYMAL